MQKTDEYTFNRFKSDEMIFFIGYAFWNASYILNSVQFFENQILFLKMLRYIGLIFPFFLILLRKKIEIKELIMLLSMSLFFIFNNVYLSKDNNYIDFIIFIIAAKGLDFLKILKMIFLFKVMMYLSIIMASVFSVLPSFSMFIDGRMRNSLGFTWVTFAPQSFFYIVSMYLILKQKKLLFLDIVIINLINLFLFFQTGTKSPFVFIIILSIGCYIMNGGNSIRKLFKWSFMLLIPLCSILILYLSYNYNSFLQLDAILSNRLRLGNQSILYNGINLWGKPVIFNSELNVIGYNYNYVDSSYLQYIIKYGVLSFMLFGIFFMSFQKKICDTNNRFVVFVLTMIIIHGTFDPQFVQLYQNVYLFLLLSDIKKVYVE